MTTISRETPTYTITPFSGQPGQDWEDFEDELYNALAMRTDERGWSLADTLDHGSRTWPLVRPGLGPLCGRMRLRFRRARNAMQPILEAMRGGRAKGQLVASRCAVAA